MNDLTGKAAIVTGGAWGIGAVVARGMARAGAQVVVADIAAERAEIVAASIRETGADAIAIGVDVSDEASVRAMVKDTIAAFGHLEILHNNAARLGDFEGGDGPVEQMNTDGWDGLSAINVRGAMLGYKWAIPHMLRAGGGSIINTTSSSGDLGDMQTAYSASKGAVSALTRSVATRYGKQRIRCNAIAPGLILHERNAEYIGAEVRALFLKHHLIDRVGTGEDIAQAAVFLASDASSFITGQVIGVDGELAAHLPYIGDMLEPGGFRWFG